MIDPVIESKLEPIQIKEITRLRVYRPDVDVNALATLIADGIFNRSLDAGNLLKAVEMMGPFALDEGKKIWHYSNGVWHADGFEELARRIVWCTGSRYRSDHVNQVASILKSQKPKIYGLGPKQFLNVNNGMLNWETLELLPHDPKYYSVYQLKANWEPESLCPITDEWMASTFDPEIVKLLWQVLGVTIHPAMGFQKAIVLIGDGLNGKGTFLRLCQSLLPKNAICSIDPRLLVNNKFASADLFGRTANICGDIERFTFNSTAEFKKISGEDEIRGERKNHDAFYFTSQATLLFSGNKMPESRDTSFGWFRRWKIIPLDRKIEVSPDRSLNERMSTELEGVLVKAVVGLRQAMSQGGFDDPEICKKALKEYMYACNTSALFVNEKLNFSDCIKSPISRTFLYGQYLAFCRERRLEPETRPKFYDMVEELGGNQISSHWAKKASGEDDRGYIGIKFKSNSMDGY